MVEPHPIYNLFRKQPPIGKGTTQSAAYWQGYERGEQGKRKFVVYSVTWWAAKAGRDNAREAEAKTLKSPS